MPGPRPWPVDGAPWRGPSGSTGLGAPGSTSRRDSMAPAAVVVVVWTRNWQKLHESPALTSWRGSGVPVVGAPGLASWREAVPPRVGEGSCASDGTRLGSKPPGGTGQLALCEGLGPGLVSWQGSGTRQLAGLRGGGPRSGSGRQDSPVGGDSWDGALRGTGLGAPGSCGRWRTTREGPGTRRGRCHAAGGRGSGGPVSGGLEYRERERELHYPRVYRPFGDPSESPVAEGPGF